MFNFQRDRCVRFKRSRFWLRPRCACRRSGKGKRIVFGAVIVFSPIHVHPAAVDADLTIPLVVYHNAYIIIAVDFHHRGIGVDRVSMESGVDNILIQHACALYLNRLFYLVTRHGGAFGSGKFRGRDFAKIYLKRLPGRYLAILRHDDIASDFDLCHFFGAGGRGGRIHSPGQ